MIDYLYLLDYESDKDTGLCMVETEPAAAADLAIEDVEDAETRQWVKSFRRMFPECDVRECLEVMTKNSHNHFRAFDTLYYRHFRKQHDQAYCGKIKEDTEGLM